MNEEKIAIKSEKKVLFYAQNMLKVQEYGRFCSKKSFLLEKVLRF